MIISVSYICEYQIILCTSTSPKHNFIITRKILNLMNNINNLNKSVISSYTIIHFVRPQPHRYSLIHQSFCYCIANQSLIKNSNINIHILSTHQGPYLIIYLFSYNSSNIIIKLISKK